MVELGWELGPGGPQATRAGDAARSSTARRLDLFAAHYCSTYPSFRFLSPPSHCHRSCMLGLRPRLKPRPSLLDLIRKNNIDQISQAPSPVPADDPPTRIPLPVSPSITPKDELSSPPPYALKDVSKKEKKKKMAPVSRRRRPGAPGLES